MQTVEREIRAPDLWRHHSSGELSCAYEGGENVFTWPPEAVAEMARRWRESGARGMSARARHFVDAHQRLDVLIREAGLRPPDVMIFDLRRGELKGVWEQEKVVLAVDGIGTGGVRPG